MKTAWGPPRTMIEAECARRGKAALVDGCIVLMGGGDADYRLIDALAGPAANSIVDREPDDEQRYWLRVWGARGLLWVWDDVAVDAVRAGLVDSSWRVREMSAKVIARHTVGQLFEAVATLREDPIPRVRAAATRAIITLTANQE